MQRIGHRNENLHDYENDYTKVLGYVGYKKDTREHIWLTLCKLCGSEKESTASKLKVRKTCGCGGGKRESPNKDTWSHELAKAWLRRPLC